MNHAITVGDILRALGSVVAVLLMLVGGLTYLAGSMSDAPAEGGSAGRSGCLMVVAGIVFLVLSLAACTTPATQIKTVEVDKPVAVQPITPAQVPVAPAPLPPRPGNLSSAADTLLSKWCEAVSYFLRADPLLRVSAGEQPQQLPRYPECEGR